MPQALKSRLSALALPMLWIITFSAGTGTLLAQAGYFPPPGEWTRRAPEELGMDSARLARAVAFAREHENQVDRDLEAYITRRGADEPAAGVLGPTKPRGGPNGLVARHGYLVTTWGDVERVDMTFSVSKSYLATIAGLAYDRGMITDLHSPVGAQIDDPSLEDPHNASITWHMLLNQTSEWTGSLWDKPDRADRRRGRDRDLNEPGTFWEYNDVRVNFAAYALLKLWERPLPVVLRELVMDPIGASDSWRWHGYRNSWIDLNGQSAQSVSGGGHWGGGVWASTLDHARFGLLMLNRGRWGERRILSEEWIDLMTQPTDVMPRYGYMWWLNTDREMYPDAPESSFFARGSGGNIIWVDPDHDLVAVLRWIDSRSVNEFIGLVLESLTE